MPCLFLALNGMVAGDLDQSLDQHRDLGLTALDLKTDWSGSLIEHSDLDRVRRIRAAAEARKMTVHCLSTCIGACAMGEDEADLVQRDEALARIRSFIPILRPDRVRLILPRGDAAVASDRRIVRRYRRWCTDLLEDGVDVVFENEIDQSLGRDPALTLRFLDALDLGSSVRVIWDVANQWQDGRFPSRADLDRLAPRLAMLHLKGGRWDDAVNRRYAWKAHLADSDWPVADLVRAAVDHGVDTFCLNPPHGATPPGFRWDWTADLAFLRTTIQDHAHV